MAGKRRDRFFESGLSSVSGCWQGNLATDESVDSGTRSRITSSAK